MKVYKRTNGPHSPPRIWQGLLQGAGQQPLGSVLGHKHLGYSSSTTGEGSIQREYEQAGTPELHARSLIDTVCSPRLRLEETREERGKRQTNKQQKQRYLFKPGSQGDRLHLRAWISRPCANVQILTSFVIVFRHWGLRCHPGAFCA